MPYKDPNCPAAKESRRRAYKKWAKTEKGKKTHRRLSLNYYYRHQEECKIRMKKWHKNNPERHKELGDRWKLSNQKKAKEYARLGSKRWRERNPDYKCKRNPDKERKKRYERRMLVLTHYGGNPPKCTCCGELHIEFLSIDHINGGGSKERKKFGYGNFFSWIIKNNFPINLQVLCMNCQFEKEYPKEKISFPQKYILKVKLETLSHYGNGEIKCSCCGKTGIEYMALHHINNNGNDEREKSKTKGGFAFYLLLKRNSFPEGYRVLCHNCNSSLGLYGYCPHKK